MSILFYHMLFSEPVRLTALFTVVPLVYFFFPEPAQLSLEEVDTLFANGKVTMRRNPRAPVDMSILENAITPKREESYVEKASV